MRFVLAACVVVGCAMGGWAVSGGSRRRLSALRELAEGLRRLKLHMTGMFEPLRHSLEAAACPLLGQVAAEMEGGRSAGEAWSRLKARPLRGGPGEVFATEDLRLLDHLFDRLGESGREDQAMLLSGTLGALEERIESARVKAGEAERLYGTLGVLVGLMLAIMLV